VIALRVLEGKPVGRLAGLWVKPGEFGRLALPSLTVKALAIAKIRSSL
jgi:hypothetical protein